MLTTDLHGGTVLRYTIHYLRQTLEVFENYFNHFEQAPGISSWLSSSDQKTITINNHKDTIRYRITAHKIYREQDSINIPFWSHISEGKVDKKLP